MAANVTNKKPNATPTRLNSEVKGNKEKPAEKDNPLMAAYRRTNEKKKWTFSSCMKNAFIPGRKEAKLAQARLENVQASLVLHTHDEMVKTPYRVSSFAPKYWLSGLKNGSAPVISAVVQAAVSGGKDKDLYSMLQSPAQHRQALDEIVAHAFEAMIPGGDTDPTKAGAAAAANFSTDVFGRILELLHGTCSSEHFRVELDPHEKERMLDDLITYAFFQGPGFMTDPALIVRLNEHQDKNSAKYKKDFVECELRKMLGKALPNLLGTASETKLKDGDNIVKFSDDMKARGKSFLQAFKARVYSQLDFVKPTKVSLEDPQLQEFSNELVTKAITVAESAGGKSGISPLGQRSLDLAALVFDAKAQKDRGYKLPAEIQTVKSGAMDDFVQKLAAKLLPGVDLKGEVEWSFVADTNTGDLKATYSVATASSTEDPLSLKVFAGTIVFSQDGSWHIQDPVTHQSSGPAQV